MIGEIMNKEEKWIEIDYLVNKMKRCPFDEDCRIDFEKECVGFGNP